MKYAKQAALSTILLSLAACGGNDGQGEQLSFAQTGNINLSITDAPVDMAEAVTITFDKVTIKPADGSPKDIQDLEINTINLLDYTGGKSELLIDTINDDPDRSPLPAGEYKWMRFHVVEASITVDGLEYELEVPSGDTSGLKLNTAFTIPADGVSYYTIDFDLRHSVIGPFTKNGSSGETYYKLKPVLRLVENTAVGTVSGTVDSTLVASCSSDKAVYLFEGELEQDALDDIDNEVLPEELDDADAIEPFMSMSLPDLAGDASFTFGFVQEGSYSLAFACGEDNVDQDEDDLEFASLEIIEVVAGETTEEKLEL